MQTEEAIIQSPVGSISIGGSENGVQFITFLDQPKPSTIIPECLRECAVQLSEYFEGKRKIFDLRLDAQGTDFQKLVWKQLVKIPFGKTISYIELARMTGSELNTRAVGNANGKNPLNIVVPCHRVIGSNGQLTGYGGGLWRKEFLLKYEAGNTPTGLFDQ